MCVACVVGVTDLDNKGLTLSSRPFTSRLLSSFLISYCVISTASYIFPKETSAKAADADLEIVRSRVEGLTQGPGSQQRTPSNSFPGPELGQNEISFPLLVYIRQRNGRPYRPSDPEWKTFQRLQQDKKLLHDLKVEVARQAEKEAKKRGQLAAFLGIIKPGQMRVNLELVVPLNRPPVYEVPYFVSKSGQASVDWRPLPESLGSKLDRAFHPIILSRAFYHGLREFWVVSYRITKARVQDRLNSTRPSSGGVQTSSSSSKINPLYLVRPPTRPPTEEEKTAQQLPIRGVSENDMKKMLPFLRGEYGEHASRQAYRDAVRSMTYQHAIESACTVFRLHWSLGQAKAERTDARDPCHIIGYVEFVGERGKLRLDVFAVYSPQSKSLVGRPMITKAYGIPDATTWHKPLSSRNRPSFLQPEGMKSPDSKHQTHPPEDSATDSSAAEKERREVGSREEERGGEK
ncbi:hypothetical protein A1O3_09195 [Capronia epimyces CBS 606.96]|uniref:Uncharacterized protein n=1 Tax=Capronia epimyces CBS 606.96 TaxID=1182542 RepID=W9XL36_9EURO|nr:uncharacterized protein A1O3_09195 [Capronia epimyces CBS 606.96]EXJ78035.1 hypothetical protein A1O3_09195 [Capronia epimyces CBS 606.96]